LITKFVFYGQKSFITLAPGMLFQPGLMFADKAGAYPSKANFKSSTLG